MSAFDLVVRGGRVVLPVGVRDCDIAIRDGRIAALIAPSETVEAADELDARGLVVLPGVIDVHLHLGHGADISRPREPADAAHAPAAAAKGGITCFIPYGMPPEPFENVFPAVLETTQA